MVNVSLSVTFYVNTMSFSNRQKPLALAPSGDRRRVAFSGPKCA